MQKSFFCLVVLLSSFLAIANAASGGSNCAVFNRRPVYEKYYPCTWTNVIVSMVDTASDKSAVFKCRNVPLTAQLSYSASINNDNTDIPYSVSTWAIDQTYSSSTTDATLYSNFYSWAALTDRSTASPQCINDPECLTTSSSDHSLSSFGLGSSIGFTHTTTYNTMILNENPAADPTSDITGNCLSLLVSLSIN